MSASSSDSWILIALTILVVLLLFYLSKKVSLCYSFLRVLCTTITNITCTLYSHAHYVEVEIRRTLYFKSIPYIYYLFYYIL